MFTFKHAVSFVFFGTLNSNGFLSGGAVVVVVSGAVVVVVVVVGVAVIVEVVGVVEVTKVVVVIVEVVVVVVESGATVDVVSLLLEGSSQNASDKTDKIKILTSRNFISVI